MGVLRVKVAGQWVDVGASMPPVYGNRNLLDNGQMAVKQRSATQVAVIGNQAYLADRHAFWNVGVGVTSLNYATTTNFGASPPSGRPRPGNIQFVQVTTAEAGAALAAGDLFEIVHAIEGQFVQHLNWGTANAQPLTWSADIYSTIAATYVVELLRTESQNRSISALITVPAGWSTQTVSFPGDTASLITNDNTARLSCNIWLAAGSTYAGGTAQAAWGNFNQANRAVGISNTFSATLNNIFAVTNQQLEIGTQATPYEVRPYDQELIKAMRYFERFDSTAYNMTTFGSGFNYTTANSFVWTPLKVQKRAAPTVVYSAASTFAVYNSAGAAVAVTAISIHHSTLNSIAHSITVASGLVAGNGTTLLANSSAATTIDASAEI